MEATTYWVGDVPAPIAVDVRDSRGRMVNCAAFYDTYEVVMLGTDNEPLDLSGANLDTSAAQLGRFIFTWPNRSVFTGPGEYVFQLRLSGAERVEHTTSHTMRVKKLGKVNR